MFSLDQFWSLKSHKWLATGAPPCLSFERTKSTVPHIISINSGA